MLIKLSEHKRFIFQCCFPIDLVHLYWHIWNKVGNFDILVLLRICESFEWKFLLVGLNLVAQRKIFFARGTILLTDFDTLRHQIGQLEQDTVNLSFLERIG